jgi:hypothetical protein
MCPMNNFSWERYLAGSPVLPTDMRRERRRERCERRRKVVDVLVGVAVIVGVTLLGTVPA